jgi:hypothetical protein
MIVNARPLQRNAPMSSTLHPFVNGIHAAIGCALLLRALFSA